MTLEGLHRLAEKRARERTKETKKRQLETKSSEIDGTSTHLKLPGSKKRKKNGAEVDQTPEASSRILSKVKVSEKLPATTDEVQHSATRQHDVPVDCGIGPKSSKRSSGKKQELSVCESSNCSVASKKSKGKSKMEDEDFIYDSSAGEAVSARKSKTLPEVCDESFANAQRTFLSSTASSKKLKRKAVQQHSSKGCSQKKPKNGVVDYWQFSGDGSEGESDDQLSCNGRLDFDGVSTDESGSSVEEEVEKEEEDETEDVEESKAKIRAVEDKSLGRSGPADEDTVPSLAPLSHGKTHGAGKRTVHRKLPEWIVQFHPVENDIQRCSR